MEQVSYEYPQILDDVLQSLVATAIEQILQKRRCQLKILGSEGDMEKVPKENPIIIGDVL
jgi:hypothetical protein